MDRRTFIKALGLVPALPNLAFGEQQWIAGILDPSPASPLYRIRWEPQMPSNIFFEGTTTIITNNRIRCSQPIDYTIQGAEMEDKRFEPLNANQYCSQFRCTETFKLDKLYATTLISPNDKPTAELFEAGADCDEWPEFERVML